ncbi:hypothetical protein [Pragia fontium]|uniref:Gp5/Type VI secretion system Vgr protein OB-fold domain-containing protein n=1 Tax=Pragia fontium DSM 5563 = ATCC 49100 TaxID=1122977 RepID=A0AAJ5BGP2_9GAMM|nr:hypothetical protein [Pragia fontium]SFC50276.1 hypothetical protein SAMN02745723_102523 [Pragia fontium DSM 5563 = ATCC 49100]
MRVIKQLMLSGDDVEIADINIALELNACGRGFITAITDKDYTGKMVRLDLGYTGLVLRWFTGFVERSQPAANGSVKLFVREVAGVFDKPWPCSMKHPTLKKMAEWLESESKIKVKLPAAEYVNKPIPNFTHSGTGYQLLSNLGRAFGVDDYIWQPLPDGGLYLGAWHDSLFAKKPIEIPPEFNKGTACGNSVTLPVIQTIRPGVVMNGQRITRVDLNGDELTLTWTPLDKSTGKALQKPASQRQIDAAYPELSAGLHLPKFARVMAPSESPTLGQQADPFRPGYAVNLQLLDENGKPAANTPEYNGVPLPVPMAGSEGGMYQFPPEGTLVEVAFTEGRPDKPFVRQTLPEGNSLPAIKPGEQLQQQRAEVSQRVTVAGDWQRNTDQAIEEKSRSRVVVADEETRTITTRKTTIKATDTTIVVGTVKLLAGAVQHIVEGDYTIGTSARLVASARQIDITAADSIKITGKPITVSAQSIEEKIQAVRKSVAGGGQVIIGSSVWIGSGGAARSAGINVMQSILDILDLIQELAQQTADHTHSNTGAPINSGAISSTGTKAETTKGKYLPLIAQGV